MTTIQTGRTAAKQERTQNIVREAGRLFAQNGYSSVSLEDIGRAVGISGPALYRHFDGKQALLAAVLRGASEYLSEGGSQIGELEISPTERIHKLIDFHVGFSLANPDVIRVQDRDISKLSEGDRDLVRSLQRRYVDMWIAALKPLIPADNAELRLRVQATFGLLNSTPHAADMRSRTQEATAKTLHAMAFSSLTAGQQTLGDPLQ